MPKYVQKKSPSNNNFFEVNITSQWLSNLKNNTAGIFLHDASVYLKYHLGTVWEATKHSLCTDVLLRTAGMSQNFNMFSPNSPKQYSQYFLVGLVSNNNNNNNITNSNSSSILLNLKRYLSLYNVKTPGCKNVTQLNKEYNENKEKEEEDTIEDEISNVISGILPSSSITAPYNDPTYRNSTSDGRYDFVFLMDCSDTVEVREDPFFYRKAKTLSKAIAPVALKEYESTLNNIEGGSTLNGEYEENSINNSNSNTNIINEKNSGTTSRMSVLDQLAEKYDDLEIDYSRNIAGYNWNSRSSPYWDPKTH